MATRRLYGDPMSLVASDRSAGIQPIDPSRYDDWDRMVGTFPGSNVFHRRPWVSALQCAYGFQPCCLVEGPLDASTSILPLMEVRSWATGARGISLPFTDHCEPLGRDHAASSRLFAAAVAMGRRQRWRYIELRGGDAPVRGAEAATSYYGHQLSLNRGAGAIHAAINESTRRSIRKAERSDVAVTISRDLEAMRLFYRLQCETRRRLGVPPQPWRFFEALQKFVVSQGGAIVLGRHRGIAIAGAVFLHQGDTVTFKYGASDRRFQSLRASNLVMWRAIERFQEQGLSMLDFGRTSVANAGLRRFKLSWGATERRIVYFRYCLRTETFVRVADRATGWPTRLFRFVPMPVARWCGALLYKHIA